jgi:hypothetical protein
MTTGNALCALSAVADREPHCEPVDGPRRYRRVPVRAHFLANAARRGIARALRGIKEFASGNGQAGGQVFDSNHLERRKGRGHAGTALISASTRREFRPDAGCRF